MLGLDHDCWLYLNDCRTLISPRQGGSDGVLAWSVSMHTDLLLARLLPMSSHQPCSSITLEAEHHMEHQFSYNHLIVMHQIPSSISSVILHCHEGLNVWNKVYNFCRWWVAAVWPSLPVKEDLLIVPSDVTRVKGCIEQQLLLWEPRFRGATHRLCEKNKRVMFRLTFYILDIFLMSECLLDKYYIHSC